MRLIERHPLLVPPLRLSVEQRDALSGWITQEVEDAFAARLQQEARWRDVLRLYEGVPKNPTRNVPIENAPNIEVTIGAIAADAIYAQALDLLYTVSPFITARAVGPPFVEHAKAVQRFANWMAANELGLREAAEHTVLDDVQLGTGIYYIPWVEHTQKTDVHRVLTRGPRCLSIDPKDFIVPGGAYGDLQAVRWCGFRFWYTEGEFRERATLGKWDASKAMPVGMVDWVRSHRETLGLTASSKRISELYEVIDLYAYYDVDGDGIDEHLLVTWDRSSRSVLKARYVPYDRRPAEAMRYQLRAHLFYGLGVLEMIRPYQEEVTEIHNWRNTNMMIANARLWKAKTGVVPETMRIWPNKVVSLDDPDSLKPEQLGEIYPSAPQAEAITLSLAERRVGVNELSMPRPSQVLGSRTPGITALSLLQQVNRRFTPAFDAIRFATAGAVRQGLYRYQERLLAGDTQVAQHLREVLGESDAALVEEVLKTSRFDDAVAVELTASSASISREADRQNAIMLVNILATYYQRTLELVAIAANPQTPEPVREVAKKIATAAGEIIDRTVRAFDQVRDPETFVVNVEAELDQTVGQVPQQGLAGLVQMLALGAGGNGRPTEPVA